MKFSVRFEESAYVINGQSVLHIIATSDTAASDLHHYTFSIKLSSTSGDYTYEWPAVMLPHGQTSVSIPFVVPMEWANDSISLYYNGTNGRLAVTMSVLYEFHSSVAGIIPGRYYGYGSTLAVTVADSVLPSVGALSYESVDEKVPEDWNVLVQGISVVRIHAPSASAPLGANIYYYYFGDGVAQTENFADISLPKSGTITISVTVEDSRGRLATSDLVLQVEPYHAPRLTALSSQRCTSDGTLSEEGTHFLARGTLSDASVATHNQTQVTVAWKKVTQTSYSTPIVCDVQAGTPIDAALEEGSSYDVKYTVTDTFYSIDLFDYVSSTVYLLHFLKGGTGIAVGKAAEQENLFDVGLDTSIRRDLNVGGAVSVAGDLVLDGVEVGETLAALHTPTESALSMNSSLFAPAKVTENKIVRCGRQVFYTVRATFQADPLPISGETILLGTIPEGWFSTSYTPHCLAIQNGLSVCPVELTSTGQVKITLAQSGQQNICLTGTGLV